MKRLLTIGHSYVVGLNRRLADEMARQGAGRWSVTAAAPASFAGDLRRVAIEPLPDEACRVVPLPIYGDRLPHLMIYGGLGRLMAEPWDAIHCWEEPYVAAAAQIAWRAPADARFVFATFQNIPKTYPPPFTWMERRVLSRANGWIAWGQTVHDAQIDRERYASLPSRVIAPGVDTSLFAPDASSGARIRRTYGWDDDVPVVGFLGRFVQQKGCALLVDALSRLTMPWRALFVGGGPELPVLTAFAEAHPGRVGIATDVSHDAVPAYLNAMTVLCAPSRTTPTWREQFGRMLIEAMACGVPVLASRSGEIPHVLKDVGVRLPEDDVAAWVEALRDLLSSPAARRDLSGRGVMRARAEFDWSVVARRHLAFFDEITG